jgi:hypothetical protein
MSDIMRAGVVGAGLTGQGVTENARTFVTEVLG